MQQCYIKLRKSKRSYITIESEEKVTIENNQQN